MALVQTRISNGVGFACRIEGPQRESSGKRRIPQFRHSRFPVPELAGLELTLLDLLRQLDSANGDCRVVESFEPQHRSNPLFDSAVVLFDEIVQVLARSHSHSARKFAGLIQLPHGAMRRRVDEMRRSIPTHATLSMIDAFIRVQLEIRRSTLEKE